MEFLELTEDEFTNFADNHPLKSFLQTKQIAEIKKINGSDIYYVGVKNNNEIIAGTMIAAYGNFLGQKHFYSPRGFLLDYEDKELLNFFTKNIKKFVKEKKGYVLRIDPYIINKERDIDGNIVVDGVDNTHIVKHLESIGYIPLNKSEQCKWMYALDVENKTEDEIFKDMRQNTRNIIRKTLKTGITIRELSYDELDVFKKIAEDTSLRKNFKDKTLSYYQNMYKLFKDKIKYLVAELDLNNYKKLLYSEKEEISLSISKLSDNKANDGKRKEMNNNISIIENKLKEADTLIEKHGDKILLSAGMFLLYGDETVYLVSGNYAEFMKFNGQYLIQWEMIKYAINNGYKRHNFYGIMGNFDKNDKDYGIYEFKKGFNGYVIELVGEFELPITMNYKIHKILSKIKSIIKK